MVAATTTQVAELDLVDRMRRLSVGSTASSFSIVSDAPSVLSLDTNGSVNGGVPVDPPSLQVLEICLEALTAADRTSDPRQHETDAVETADPIPDVKNTHQSLEAHELISSTPDVNAYWLQFPGFIPNPTATFTNELERLAKHENWTNKKKRKQQVKALSTEIAHHYGTHMNKLDRWQQLCEDVGIDVVPTSIRQCRKTVAPVLVNLYNVIDHRRNPDVKVRRFKSYGEFCRYTRAGHVFPRECAKQDGLISVLLKRM
ncbi:hypothetical protein BDU57DRAFT_534707 [Ampelomyces quisqualis]|uniref:Uncharacterized protein n=1 Tax=Ampelomyces quisqualis TaxID=50730 RepID=A0A6A5QYW4_AMPQU|nr:hypothetical protein BDU57DRAFT_534707 [Ampelomyces quisqualis]